MRKIVFYGAISLDGFLADEKDDLQWLFDTDLERQSTYEAFAENVDTIVMGSVTFLETRKIMGDEELFPGKEKVIFSHTLTSNNEKEKIVSGDVVKILKEYQQKNGKMIWIVGGGNLLKPLLEADMIDEYWIQVAPVLLGKGKRLFEEGEYRYRLEFIDTTQMGELTELHFKRK